MGNYVPPGMEGQANQIGVDFDGVLHNDDKGWHDGTCYGEPIPGSLYGMGVLSSRWKVIVHTAKARPDRPLVNGKTGKELVWEWLEKHGFAEYVADVTHEKPQAVFYIDDKAIRFVNWDQTLREVSE